MCHVSATKSLPDDASRGLTPYCLKSKPQVKCHWSLPAG